MINYECFEKLVMNGETEQSAMVRIYFIKLRKFIVEHQATIFQAIENKHDLSIYRGYDSMYFFAADERHPDKLKAGRTNDIVQRLRNYNVGRITEVDLKYFALVENPLLIEKCVGLKLDKQRVFPGREIFIIEPKKLKKMIETCYFKHVSKQQNDELYKEMADLLGLYAYTKNKVNIKPYVIIRE
jgi:hypothetical protein